MWTLIYGLLMLAFSLTCLYYLAFLLLWLKDFLKEIFEQKTSDEGSSTEENTFS